MGIYIKNISMPTERNEMILRIQPDGAVFDKYAHYIGMFASYVPPHGKLGDMDALVAAYDAEHVGPPGRARELIIAAPTVIPAEGE